jgi:hypothetical protein
MKYQMKSRKILTLDKAKIIATAAETSAIDADFEFKV